MQLVDLTLESPTENLALDEALLDEAEENLNSVGAQVMAEVQAERAQQALRGQGWIRRFRRRNP